MSSLNTPFLSGANGVRYGTPNDVVVVSSAKCRNIPIDRPKNPANAPRKIYRKRSILKL